MKFDQMKDLFSSVLGTVTEKGQEYAETAMDKAKAGGRLAKLSLTLAGEKESLKKAYAALGQAYFEGCKDSAEGLFAQLCEEVDAVNARIQEMESEIADLKAGFTADGDVDVSFEEVVEAAEKEAEGCCDGDSCCCTKESAEEEKCCCEETEEKPCCCEEKAEEKPCCCEEKPEEPKSEE